MRIDTPWSSDAGAEWPGHRVRARGRRAAVVVMAALLIAAGAFGLADDSARAARPSGPGGQAAPQADLTADPSSSVEVGPFLVLKRRRGQLALPVNHLSNAALEQTGYDNEIAVGRTDRPGNPLQTLYRPKGKRYVGEIDLHFDARRMLFTMPTGRRWHVWEISVDGTGLRRVTPEIEEADHFDACYLPDGRIVFGSTASFTAVPCWHGKQRACCLFSIGADGSGMRQLCFDQDLDLHPSVLGSGQVVFSRWDYTGTMHAFLRPLMAMNPDGTGQRAIYGSNSYFPNALYFPRSLPGEPEKIVAILAGYHGVPRMGQLVLLDTTRGWHDDDGIVEWIACEPMEPVIRDRLVDGLWPQFLHPFPLDDGRFLVSAKLSPQATWGIYLADLDDNLVPVLVDPKYDFFEPIPLRPRPTPELIPDRIDPSRSDAVVYLHDVYAGPGLRGVPHGAVENLRVIAYEFGYPGMAGPDKIGSGGPWEAMRILGTTPVADDGSAVFRVPANTPICVQPLDAQGKALQLMRSWFTAMPGETVSCVGCHEHPGQTPAVRYELAATQPPHDLQPWYGPPRGFDFERELQPVLDRYCVECHNGGSGPSDTGGKSAAPDLRGERLVDDYRGRPLAKLGFHRLHPQLRELWGGAVVRYTPAYEALVPYIRRVGIEDDVRMLVPGEYHADTSELVQMLAKGHGGVELDAESWDRLITWIDLNGPCHGSWRDVGPIPDDADKRRQELAAGLVPVGNDAIHPTSHRVYPGGKPSHTTSHRVYPGGKRMDEGNVSRKPRPREVTLRARTVLLARSPVGFDHTAAASNPRAGSQRKTIDLGGEVTLDLVRIPAGKFVMGSNSGPSDERPPHAVTIGEDFWIGATEITIAQFRRFAPEFHPGYFMKRYPSMDGPGLLLEGPRQPVVRVSWHQARAFCQWLSQRTGLAFDLPTEVQWEYAARAGTTAGVPFGSAEGDFSPWANLADASLARRPSRTAGLESNITAPFGPEGSYRILPGGDIPCAPKFDDGFVATAPVGSFRANAWGLHDMHGNAAEWTRSLYRPYPYRDGDGRNDVTAEGKRVLRGGSFRDRPRRCTASYRLGFPPWQRVHSAGFRIVCRVEPAGE